MAHCFRTPDVCRVIFIVLILNVRLLELCCMHHSGLSYSSILTVSLVLVYFPLVYRENPPHKAG